MVTFGKTLRTARSTHVWKHTPRVSASVVGLMVWGWAFSSGAQTTSESPQFKLGIESQFHREVITPQVFPILDAQLNYQKNDLRLRVRPNDPRAFAVTSQNLNFQIELAPVSLSLGRKHIRFSQLDQDWGIGEFEPLDAWDRLRPSPQGLTGVFLEFQTQKVQWVVFGSFLALPEINPSLVIENNQFVLTHPQSIANAPQTYTLLDRPKPLGYQLSLPALSKILLRPSGAFKASVDLGNVQTQVAYGYLPMNYYPVALQGTLAIPLDSIVVNLRPRLFYHHLIATELQWRASNATSFGVSALGKLPVADELGSNETSSVLSNSLTLSPHVKHQWNSWRLLAGTIWTWGGLEADQGPFAPKDRSIFSSRMLFRGAGQIKLAWNNPMISGSWKLVKMDARYVYEWTVQGHWVALDAYWNLSKAVTLLAGGDVLHASRDFAANRGAEFLADVRALDRLRIGVSYVF